MSPEASQFESRYGLLNGLYELAEGCQRLAGRDEDPLSPLINMNISQMVRFSWKSIHLLKPYLGDEPPFVVKLASVLRTDYRPSNALRSNKRMPSVSANVGKTVQPIMQASLEEEGLSQKIERDSRPRLLQ